MNMNMGEWKWRVRCYYAEDVEPPRVPGKLALTTLHKSDHSKDVEVATSQANRYFGKIEVTLLNERSLI